jgi:hypothetical protein
MWGKKSTIFSASGGLDNGVNFRYSILNFLLWLAVKEL